MYKTYFQNICNLNSYFTFYFIFILFLVRNLKTLKYCIRTLCRRTGGKVLSKFTIFCSDSCPPLLFGKNLLCGLWLCAFFSCCWVSVWTQCSLKTMGDNAEGVENLRCEKPVASEFPTPEVKNCRLMRALPRHDLSSERRGCCLFQ